MRNMPAARMGDMHVCPMVTPGTPPIPHVGGPILKGSTGVLIGGMPAARMGDMAICTGPPDSIIMGCMTVLIGETMAGGGGGGGAGAGSGMGNAAKGALMSASIAGNTQAAQPENHTLDVTFVDKAGLPVGGVAYKMKWPDGKTTGGVLGGKIKRTGVPDGDYDITLRAITGATWDKQEAEVGQSVKMQVETVGFDNGEKAEIQIFVNNASLGDHLLDTITTEIKGNKIEKQWKLEINDKYLELCSEKAGSGRYSQPCFYYEITSGELSVKSSFLYYKDYIEIELKDHNNDPVANEEYELHLPTGEIRKGTLDGNGYKKEENVPPGNCRVVFPGIEQHFDEE
ncbi:MAG: hypothetical protein GF350_03045 [Chitinivibrionales bacterium]|nr:hypothetical protein [Chitinivibrionales bacterium]